VTSCVSLRYFVAEKLRVKLWKKFESPKNGKVWGPISRLWERNCKKPTSKSFYFCPPTICNTHNISNFTPFSHILRQTRQYPKNSKIWRAPWGPLLGIEPWNFAPMGLLGLFRTKKKLAAENLKLGKILWGSQKSIFSQISRFRDINCKKSRQPSFLNSVADRLARLYENLFDKSLRILQSKWTTLNYFRGTPPPALKDSWRGF